MNARNYDHRIILLFIAVAFALLPSCSNRIKGMEYRPKEYSKVISDHDEPNDCSPEEPPPGWSGIEINVPEMAIVERRDILPVIPICGYYKLKVVDMERTDAPMKIVIRELKTDSIFVGSVIRPQKNTPLLPERPEGFEPEPTDPRLKVGGFFNTNAMDHVPLRMEPGEFEIYIEYGGQTSNIKKILVKFN